MDAKRTRRSKMLCWEWADFPTTLRFDRMTLRLASAACACACAVCSLVWFARPGHFPLTGWTFAGLAVLAGLVWLAEKEANRWPTLYRK